MEQNTTAWPATEWREVRDSPDRLEGTSELTQLSVVQRQLWLMNEGGLTKSHAYDVARKEFYALRHEEEIERQVAKEEALWVGATFGKTRLEIGMELEDKVYEGWKTWANEEILKMERMRDSAYTGIGTKNADDGSSDVDTFADADSMAAEDDTGAR